MNRMLPLAAVLLTLPACSSKSDDTAESADSGGNEVDTDLPARVPQLEGTWSHSDGAWSADQCNGPMTIGAPDSSTLSNSLPDSFSLNVFAQGEAIIDAPVDCTVQEDASFVCTEFTSGWNITGIDASIGLTGTITLNFSTESDVDATADMIMTCTGNDCDLAGESAGISENPCSTTYTWSATYQGQ